MPNRTVRPCSAARDRGRAIFSATRAGGSPQVRRDLHRIFVERAEAHRTEDA
ncbi:hypothetical protein ACWF76_22020 [Streptomyces globisporus]